MFKTSPGLIVIEYGDPTPTQEIVIMACVNIDQAVNIRLTPAGAKIGVLQSDYRLPLLDSDDEWWEVLYQERSAWVAGWLMKAC